MPRKIDPGGSELGFDLRAKRLLLARTVVGIVHAEEIKAVIGKKREAAWKLGQLVEIEQEPIGAIGEPMAVRPETMMGHAAHVKGGSQTHDTSSA